MISTHVCACWSGRSSGVVHVDVVHALERRPHRRGVHINSLSISDHNMLEFGDGVVIGENVHLSGHTVEGGMVKTGPVKLSRFVTVGLGSMVGINVEAGEKCQIGAMSVVLKGTTLDAESVYVGVPVRKVERNSQLAVVETALLDA
jgi:acetyltransferase-like isoleucine patch superfamily enzyme